LLLKTVVEIKESRAVQLLASKEQGSKDAEE